MSGAIALAVALLLMGATLGYLLGAMGTGIRREVRSSDARPMKHFGLSIVLAVLFFASWIGQGISQFQEFTDEQLQHGSEVSGGDFVAVFSSTTLENWQSEFLQLFSFVVLSAVLIHRGSAESKDSDDRMEQALERIESALGTTSEDPSLDDGTPGPHPEVPA